MATLEELRQAIEKVFAAWHELPGPEAAFAIIPVSDRQQDRYLLLEEGWEGRKRIHGLLADLEIRDGKIWVQADNTDRPLAEQLLRHGIPREQIVLGFRSPERRAASEFAVA
jgi:hypothetical protein